MTKSINDDFKYNIIIGEDSPYNIIARKVFNNIVKEKKWIFKGINEYKTSDFEFYDYSGEKTIYSTSQSPNKHKEAIISELIEEEVFSVKIIFDGKYYNTKQLIDFYDEFSQSLDDNVNELPDIINKKELSPDEFEEIKKFKNREEARKWKSRQRSLRRKGKLEQYKIDMLNKLGMIWHPVGLSSSKDEWEKKYLSFRKNGLCLEIKDWVDNQRELYENKSLSKENLLRLQAVNFPFQPTTNEKYKLTKQYYWDAREKLNKKVEKYKVKRFKELSVYEKPKRFYGTKKEHEKLKKSQKEVNSFYNRKYSYCSPNSIKKCKETEALKIISSINNGVSYYNSRLKEFLDKESETYKENNKRIPQNVKRFYGEVDNINLTKLEIYKELSQFNESIFNGAIRKKACQYMLDYLPLISLKTARNFKEINYLISTYKKEKNLSELILLRDYIIKYPMLNEFYGDKINLVILKLKV